MYSIQWSLSTRDKYDGVCTVYSGASLQGTCMTVLCMYSIQWSLSTRDMYDGVCTVYSGASLQGTCMMVYVQYTVEPLYKGHV